MSSTSIIAQFSPLHVLDGTRKGITMQAQPTFLSHDLSAFIASLVASNIESLPEDACSAPSDIIEEKPMSTTHPEWLSDDGTALIESLLPVIKGMAYNLHFAVSYALSVSIDDLVQEGMIKVWKCIQQYDASKTANEISFRKYCLIYAKGGMHSYIRSLSRRHAISLDELLGRHKLDKNVHNKVTPLTVNTSSNSSSLEDNYKRIQEAISHLNTREKLVVMAYYRIEGEEQMSETMEEAIVRLGCSLKSLHATKSRALKKLAKILV